MWLAKKIAKIILYLFAIWVAFIGTLALVNHSAFLYQRLTAPPLEEGMMVPEPPLPGDDAFRRIIAIAEPIHRAVYEDMKRKQCLTSVTPHENCVGFLTSQAEALHALDEWLASPVVYKLDRPANLGLHVRDPVDLNTLTMDDDGVMLSQREVFETLWHLLRIRSRESLERGNAEAATRDIETILALGDYLQQNSGSVEYFRGGKAQMIGLAIIRRHYAPEQVDGRVEGMLPDPDALKAGFRMAFGREWVARKNTFDRMDDVVQRALDREHSGGIKQVGSAKETFSWWEMIGLYNREDTKRLWLKTVYRPTLNHLENGKLGASFFVRSEEIDRNCFRSWFIWSVIHNGIGRIFVCMEALDADVPRWLPYVAQIGERMDIIQATRIVLAARRFNREQKRWPTLEAELVPAYLKTWPISALDGQPLRWLEDRTGVVLLKPDGITMCREESCRFPFKTPQPLGVKEGPSDLSVRPALPPMTK